MDYCTVIFAESPSDVIKRSLEASWGLFTQFVKRSHFSGQNAYRFVISIGGLGDPIQISLALIITEKLTATTVLVYKESLQFAKPNLKNGSAYQGNRVLSEEYF